MAGDEKKIGRRVRNAYLVSTVSIALVLFLLGTVGYLILNARKASDSLRENMTVSVLLKDGLSETETEAQEDRLRRLPQVRDVSYISKEAAAEEFEAYAGSDFRGFLDGNPLPASCEVRLRAESSRPDTVKRLDAEWRTWEGVDDVLYQAAVIEQVTDNIEKFNLVMLIFGGTLLLISLILIHNTIRMAIFAKRFIINTMKLVGATRGFILRPFLAKALMQGIAAALIASALIAGVVYGLNRGVPEAGFILAPEPLLLLFAGIVGVGVLISLLFTSWAVRKYVRLDTGQISIY